MQNKCYKYGLALQILSVGHGKGQFLLDRRLMDHHPLAHSGELHYFIHTEIFASNFACEKAFRILLPPIREAKRVFHT